MWRWLLFAAIVVALFFMAAMYPVFMSTESKPGKNVRFPVPAATEGPQPRAEVTPADLTYDFGVLSVQEKAKHGWVLKNAGEGPLKVMKGTSSCSCTIASLPDGQKELVLKPGESTPIELAWETKEAVGPFSKNATILTSDLDHEEIKFFINGTVRPPVIVLPESVIGFDDFPSISTPKKEFVIYSPDKADLEITEIATSRPDFLKIKPNKLTQEDLESLMKMEQTTSKAQDKVRFKSLSGVRFELSIKPGMPIGPFKEDIQLTTNHPKHPNVHIVVIGRSVGPISFSPGSVTMPHVSGMKGGKTIVNVFARGAADVHFEATHVPAPLKVEFVKVDDRANPQGKASRYNLVVTVPPDSKAQSIRDETIEFKTDHPEAPLIILPCYVVIEAR